MATRDELYPSAWVKATDVEPPVTATIDRCTMERVGRTGAKEDKLVVHFRGDVPKPLIVNRTNFDALVAISGERDSDHWAGVVVELYAVDVVGPDGPTRGTRVRLPRQRSPLARPASTQRPPVSAVPPEPPPPDGGSLDDIPF